MNGSSNAAASADVLRDLAPAGVLRAAINLGNSVLAQRDADSGALRGISVELAHTLAARLGAALELVAFNAAGRVVEALREGAWDVAFLAIDPTRSAEILFTPPYLLIEGAYLVPQGSPLRDSGDVDRAGHLVATGAGSAYDLHLTRTLQHARIERRPTAREAFDLLAAGGPDAAAGVRQVAGRYARERGGLRLVDPSFMVIKQAMATPISRSAGASYLGHFVEEMKASGFVAQALARSGQSDATVAPPGAG